MTPTNKDPKLLEDALRNALRRETAPEDFTVRVLASVAQQSSTAHQPSGTPWLSTFTQPLVRWAAFAAVSICLLIGGVRYRNQLERARGEAAKQQLMLALRIAGSKLQLAKEKVHEINQPEQRQPRTARSRS